MFRENSGFILYIHRPPTTLGWRCFLSPRTSGTTGLDTPSMEHPPIQIFYQNMGIKNKRKKYRQQKTGASVFATAPSRPDTPTPSRGKAPAQSRHRTSGDG